MTHLSRLVLLQKRAIRVVSGAYYLDHTKPLFLNAMFVKHSVLTLHNLHIYLTAQFMYLLKNMLLPPSCSKLVELAPINRAHALRKTSYFLASKCRINMKQHSIGFAGPTIWNKIPGPIQLSVNIGVFNKHLRLYLFSL